ncbi:hypothetical protein QZH41_012848 [Actinostola sp. cb2023]|nr:hypothetical protein QZH41_012848 [Actinostola sp. cb2023]
MDDHSDQSEIISSEEEHSDDGSPENFTDDSQESESSESINYDSSDCDYNRSIPQCWTTLIDEAMGRHEVGVESFMEEYEQQEEHIKNSKEIELSLDESMNSHVAGRSH